METIYIKKGRVFSGYDEPSRIANILVEGGKVARISEEPILGNPRPLVVDARSDLLIDGRFEL